MGSANERPPPEGLLRQRAARRNDGGLAGAVWRLFWHLRRAGLRIRRQRRYLAANCSRPPGCSLRRGAGLAMIRVVLPFHLRTLARVDGEVQLEVQAPATLGSILDALEARYP